MKRIKDTLYTVIFEAETPAGKAFDIGLLVFISISILTVMLESITAIRREYLQVLMAVEWGLTLVFTIEYFLRIYSSPQPARYIFSALGIIDFLAIIPTYLSLFIVGAQYLLVIRALRLLRMARILKLTHFIYEGQILANALRASLPKITVFIGTVITLVIIVGTVQYVVEGAESGFTSIPVSIYWAIVTLTTVGYGDISPVTPLGQFLASCLMITGYGIIAVPTGIVTVELAQADRKAGNTIVCPNCHKEGHAKDANYCSNCGYRLREDVPV
ncbi:ion transporter [Pontibacter sp. SGAir0037]|uniref:ion transporter n=1 Tax=Pontibacter sp. SGAir0037 TaxID=2571030 RepID=UPI0010CD4237|nr:ion transporter [Pontibacter sp. SGAir0037]QCR22200.1 ion transporter [Pontibacter sp. SGAir0037]